MVETRINDFVNVSKRECQRWLIKSEWRKAEEGPENSLMSHRRLRRLINNEIMAKVRVVKNDFFMSSAILKSLR